MRRCKHERAAYHCRRYNVGHTLIKARIEDSAIKTKRRWSQYSLRTLFVAMAVLGAWLAVEVNSARRQRHAVEQIKFWGGKVEYDALPPGQAESALRSLRRRLFGNDAVAHVVSVTLRPSRASFESKAPAGPWPGEAPFTDGPAIDDEGLKVVARLSKLRTLNLSWTDISDAGLAHLTSLAELRCLYLYQTRISDDGLFQLRPLKRLETIGLSGKSIGDAAFEHLGTLGGLKHVVLDDSSVTSRGLKHLKSCAGLRYVSVVRCSKVNDEGLEALAAFGGLIEADLRDTAVTDRGAAQLKALLPECTIRY